MTSATLEDTYDTPPHGWTCFHCGETFPGTYAGQHYARVHFGTTPDAKPGCMLKVEHGEERALLMEFRRIEDAMRLMQSERLNEDTELHRRLAQVQSDAAVRVRRAEEEGYARGLEDAKKYPETLGLQRLDRKETAS